MTVENSSTAPEVLESTEIDSEVSEALDTPEADESDESAPEDDPDESFDDWLKRQNKPKEEKNVKSDQKDEKTTHNESKTDETTHKEVEKQEVQSDKIKIKDKEYTTEELEKSLSEGDLAKEQYSTLQQQAEQLVNILKTNPGQILDKLEVNKDVIEQWYYKKYIEPEVLTPEERQAKADQEELNQRRKQDQERAEREEAERNERLREQRKQELYKQIRTILESSQVPESPFIVSRIAQHMKNQVKPEDIVVKIQQEWADIQKNALASLPPEKIPDTLGEDLMAKVRKIEAEKFKQQKFENKAPTKGKAREIKKKPGKRYRNAYDLLDDL